MESIQKYLTKYMKNKDEMKKLHQEQEKLQRRNEELPIFCDKLSQNHINAINHLERD
jgi:hypothetical protein